MIFSFLFFFFLFQLSPFNLFPTNSLSQVFYKALIKLFISKYFRAKFNRQCKRFPLMKQLLRLNKHEGRDRKNRMMKKLLKFVAIFIFSNGRGH